MDSFLRVKFDGVTYDLDVLEQTQVRVDISAIENSEIGEIFGAASQEFTLPGSKTNNRFFKHAYKFNSLDTPALHQSVPAVLIVDGEDMLEGSLFLEEVIRLDDGSINYEVILTNNTITFNESIKGISLQDLDWSKNSLDHNFTVQNITSSWDNNLFGGKIFYPLVDLGSDGSNVPSVSIGGGVDGFIDSSNTPMGVNQFTPAIQVKEILQRIFDYGGFSYSSSLDDFFETLYVLPKQTDDLSIRGTDITGYNFIGIKTSSIDNQIPSDGGFITASIDSETLDESDNYNTTTYTYTIEETGLYQFEATYKLRCSAQDDDPFYFGVIRDVTNGVNFASKTHTPGGDDTETEFVLTSNLLPFNQGTQIQAQIEYIQGDGGNDLDATLLTGSLFQTLQTPSNYTDAVISIKDQFDPQTKVKDFLLGLIQKFNLVIEPIYTEERKFKIETYTDWVLSGERKDWSDKVNNAKRISIKSPLSSQPKTLIFEDIKDNDKLSKRVIDNAEGYQWGTEVIDAVSDIPQGERKLGKYFSPIILESMLGSADSLLPQLYKVDDSEQPKKTFKFKPKLGYKVDNLPLDRECFIGPDAIPFNSYSTISNYDSLPITGSVTKNLHFNESFYPPTFTQQTGSITTYEEYWRYFVENSYSEEIRLLNLEMEFDPNELRSIKLNDKIFVNNTLYRINKISGFNLINRDVVNVELITAFPNDGSDVEPTFWSANKRLELNVTNNTTNSFELGRVSWNYDDTEGLQGGPTREPLNFGYFSYIEDEDFSSGNYSTPFLITGSNINNTYATYLQPFVTSSNLVYNFTHKKDGVTYLTGSNTQSIFQHAVLANDFLSPTQDWTTMSIDVEVENENEPTSPTKRLELNITNNTTESLDEAFLIFNIDDTGTRQEGTGPFNNYFYYISQSAVPTGFTQYTGSIFLTQSFQSSPQDAFRFSTRPDVPSQFIYSITASLQKDDVEFLELNDADGLFSPTAATILNPTESFATFSIDVTVDYSSSITPPETGSIEVASILLINGSCDGGEDPTGSFEGRMFVTASWSGFTTNGSGKLVVNNGLSFNAEETPTIDPSDPNVVVVSESVDFPQSTELLTVGETYLVHVDSLRNPIVNPFDKVETSVNLSATASFTTCEL